VWEFHLVEESLLGIKEEVSDLHPIHAFLSPFKNLVASGVHLVNGATVCYRTGQSICDISEFDSLSFPCCAQKRAVYRMLYSEGR
jgi:hypothetical protein